VVHQPIAGLGIGEPLGRYVSGEAGRGGDEGAGDEQQAVQRLMMVRVHRGLPLNFTFPR
jgi:hypothetical protein